MRKFLLLIAVALALALATLPSLLANATPTDQSKNLIKNGMIETFVPYGEQLVGEYWTPYVLNGNPQFGSNGFEPGQQIYSPGPAITAGIYQQVTTAIPGAMYYCFVGTAAKWGAMDSGRWDGHIGRTIGVDPYGGTDPSSPNVIWGSQVWDDAHWNWKDDPNANAPKAWVQAKSNKMTLFLKVMYLEGNNQATIWLADAAIMLDETAPTSTPNATSTFTPTPTRTPTPTHTPTPTATPIPVLSVSSTNLVFLAEQSGDPMSSQTLQLANIYGGSQLSWEVESANSWLTVDPLSGSSVPRNVMVSVDAASLPPGRRTGRLTFRNLSNSSQPDIRVDVTVSLGPLTKLYFPLAFR